jgi:aromatic-L-amino-acid decarboxylase
VAQAHAQEGLTPPETAPRAEADHPEADGVVPAHDRTDAGARGTGS